MIGIGIDTGGTCTDCVIIDTDSEKVLSWGKTQTTRYDLKEGIVNVLKSVDQELLQKAEFLSLSTTLATNACVEEKGGRAKLCFIGLNPKSIKMMEGTYGLPEISDIYFADGENWDAFEKKVEDEFGSFDSAAVVQLNPAFDDGAKEKQAEKIIHKYFDIPVVRGYDLFQEINVQKRGATALLNARLMPVMSNFIDSIKASLKATGLDVPIKIVKSDGSVMSVDYALTRPVETLLSGPAASIMGAMKLSSVKDAIICDIGGTTTDCAVIKNSIPVTDGGGINIGRWKTMVKGVSIDTFALGGDTGVGYYHGELVLGERRAIPLAALAVKYPYVIEKLRDLVKSYKLASYPASTFIVLQNEPDNISRFTASEQKLIEALRNGPLIYSDAAMAIGLSPYTFKFDRLENEGVVIRSQVTPTDVMHIRGDFTGYSVEAAELGIRYYSFVLRKSVEDVAEGIYKLARERLYSNLVRILMGHEMGKTGENGMDETELRRMTSMMFDRYYDGQKPAFLNMCANAAIGIIGIGAPTGVLLPDAAKLMNADPDIPEYSHVANAVGAALGTVFTEYHVKISIANGKYILVGGDGQRTFEIYGDALKEAKKTAFDRARKKALDEGAEGEPEVTVEVVEDFFYQSDVAAGIHIGTEVVARAKKR